MLEYLRISRLISDNMLEFNFRKILILDKIQKLHLFGLNLVKYIKFHYTVLHITPKENAIIFN